MSVEMEKQTKVQSKDRKESQDLIVETKEILMDYSMNLNDQQYHVIKYIIGKLENYAGKSQIWRLFHSSHLRRHLLRRSGRVSRMYSISEDLVRQCINQLFHDVDQYVTQLHRLIYSSDHQDLIPFFNYTNARSNNAWYAMQLKRARYLFPHKQEQQEEQEQLNDHDLLTHYYKYIDEKLTPKHFLSSNDNNQSVNEVPRETSFNLNDAYEQAQSEAKQYLKTLLANLEERRTPDLQLIDEMMKLGLADMKNIPSEEDFEMNNHLLGRLLIFHEIKRAYKSILENTGDDFMILRFGKFFTSNELENTEKMKKQFVCLLHLFLKSIAILFTLLKSNTNENIVSSISKLSSLFFFHDDDDDEESINRLNNNIFSPEFHVDQWTWLLEKWKDILRTIPLMFIEVGAFSRLIRTTIGIGLMYLGKQSEILIHFSSSSTIHMERINQELFYSLQIGFYFGIAYAIVDSLQDEICNLDSLPLHHFLQFNLNKEEKVLQPNEIVNQWILIMEEFLSGNKSKFNENQFPQTPFTKMLIDSFDNLFLLMKLTENNENYSYESFNQLALLLRSQRLDQKTTIEDEILTNEQLYLGSILKSHFTSKCTTFLINMKSARNQSNDRLWFIPFLGQLTDDCRDFNQDLKSKSMTPFTFYALTKQEQRSHLFNPFYLFLNLCSIIYQSTHFNHQTGAFLGRRLLRALNSIQINENQKISYLQFLHFFTSQNPHLFHYFSQKLYKQFHLINDPEKNFFRLIDQLSFKYSKTNRKLQTYVSENIIKIEDSLIISSLHSSLINEENLLISAMNYSVKAGGKRLRPLLMLMIADLINIPLHRILPLTSGIEYLHTSSLIFDDLPAQDNSDRRRGQTSLHKTIINNDIPINLSEGRAQLAAVDLIAISMNIINHGLIKNGFLPQYVNRVIGEISLLMHDLCIGQMMDLRAARTGLNHNQPHIDQLDEIAWFKTGKTIEVVMVMPIILNEPSSEQQDVLLNHIRQLSRLMGILFQMRDDLLDLEDNQNIGKPKALDIQNNTVTYVSLLGVQQTQQRLQLFLHQALDLVDQCWPQGAETVKDVIRYIVHRKN